MCFSLPVSPDQTLLMGRPPTGKGSLLFPLLRVPLSIRPHGSETGSFPSKRSLRSSGKASEEAVWESFTCKQVYGEQLTGTCLVRKARGTRDCVNRLGETCSQLWVNTACLQMMTFSPFTFYPCSPEPALGPGFERRLWHHLWRHHGDQVCIWGAELEIVWLNWFT